MGTIIGFVSQKGGVGKSTLSRAVAREAANEGLNVKIADLDTQQGTSVNWHRRRLEAELEPIFSVEPYRTAKQAIAQADAYDLFILDGPARTSGGTLDIAKAADLIVQPTGASLDDLEPAILVFHELVKAGIPRDKLAFALCRVGTEAEERDCRDYIGHGGNPAHKQRRSQRGSRSEARQSRTSPHAAPALFSEFSARVFLQYHPPSAP